MSRFALAPLLLALVACSASPPRWEVRQLGSEPLSPVESVAAQAVSPAGEAAWAFCAVLPSGKDSWDRWLARTEDGGVSWTRLPARGLGDALCLAAGTGVLLAGDEEGLAISRDGGASFARAGWEPDGIPMLLAVAPFDPARLVCVTQDGRVDVSADGGASWSACPPCKGLPAGILPLPGRLLFLTDQGIFSLADGEQSWKELYDHGCPGPAALVASAGGELIVAATRTLEQTDRLVRSLDGGRTWTALPGIESVADVALDPRRSATLYALSTSEGGSVLMSSDGGEGWAPISGDLSRDAGHPLFGGSNVMVLGGERTTVLVTSRLSRLVLALEDPQQPE